jgi:hypothetical protein
MAFSLLDQKDHDNKMKPLSFPKVERCSVALFADLRHSTKMLPLDEELQMFLGSWVQCVRLGYYLRCSKRNTKNRKLE